MIYLPKVLAVFVLPVGATLILVSVGLWARRRILIWVGLAVLWLCSTPLVSDALIRVVEGRAVRIPATDAPRADAVVVLGGGRIVAPGKAAISEWGDPDRFFGGVELYRAGKAPLLVFTGGWQSWEPSASPEGEVLAQYARGMGVAADSVVTTGRVSNTAQEAAAVALLLRARRTAGADAGSATTVLLVTSAYHMARARRLFQHAGLKVEPFPVDFQVSAARTLSVLDFLPNAEALMETERAGHELYGRLFDLLFR
jgi:uncharacterized SAM-binding protein YcdF (DUF218 family)